LEALERFEIQLRRRRFSALEPMLELFLVELDRLGNSS
jgi:hypothetical protein